MSEHETIINYFDQGLFAKNLFDVYCEAYDEDEDFDICFNDNYSMYENFGRFVAHADDLKALIIKAQENSEGEKI